MNNLMASVLTLVLLVPSPAFGQTPTLDDGPKASIVSVPPRGALASPLGVSAAREAARLAKLAPSSSSPQQLQQRSWARHPVALGSLIGLGVGFGLGAATCTFPGVEGPCGSYTYESRPRMAGGIFLGLIGTGVGAGIGAILSATRR